MSQEEPSDLSALDSLFSRYGQGGARGLSEQRKKQIYAGKQQEDQQESSNPTHKTLQAILDYEETIPDREVDEFVTKIRDTRLLDDYPEDDTLESTEAAPAYNPWPLDEDTSPATMADPLSGEILVTDLQNTLKPEPEEDETLDDASAHQEDDPASLSESDIDDEEAEDLTEEFEKERAKEDVSADHHGGGDAQKDEDGDEDLFPRIDDDADKDQSVKMVDVLEEEEEEEEDDEEKEEEEDKADKEEEKKEEDKEEDKNETDTSADTTDIEVDSRTSPVQINVELCEDSLDSTDGITDTDGKTLESQGNTAGTSEKSPQEKKKENVPDFETFLAELGVDPRETLDVEVQKSRARLSRLGPMAQRRPMTKRFSGGDEDGSKWMFVDSTEPKPQRSSIDEEDEEEKETPVKAPAPQPASKPGMRKPPGGIGLGPMVLPGLGTALGGAKLKKTPTSTPNKTFQKSIEESKVSISKSEPTRTTPLSSLKKTPPPASKAPPPASKAPPTTATKPLLIKKKPLAKPRPASQAMPSKEPSQPAWLKELKSKPKPEVKETKKEEDKLNSDILHPKKTTPSETAPKSPSWIANSKTKKLPPIPSSSSTPKQEVESSTSNIPAWKQELMKKKKAPVPAPSSVNKTPVKSRILPKSPTKSPAKPPIARKPGFPPPKPSQTAGTDKGSDLKREEESRDETDSKKIKLSQSMDSSLDEEKMDVSQEETPGETPEEKPEETSQVPKDDENKDDCQGKDVEMKQEEEEEKEEEKEEEVKVVKTGEKKVIIITKEKSEKEENKPFKPEEHKETMVSRNDGSQNTVKEKQDEEKNKKGGVNLEVMKDEKKVEKPIVSKPKTDIPKIKQEETSKVKPVKVFMKTDSKKEEPTKEKAEEKKVTIVTKSESKMEAPKKQEQKKVTIVTEDKNSDSDSSMPKWKREARERMQKRKMSGGNIVPMRSPKDTIETSNNNTPLWKKELVEKRKLFPKMPSLDNEEKGSVESQKSEKVLKRHTIAAEVPTISVPAGHKMGTPTWKQELEKKNARLAKHLAVKDAERDKDY
eukprot:XP_800655.3 PREDICTED: histone-lysine N-methyltransferase SETD1B isoform X3 [Strongylocentrotus purpuratus]